MAESRLQQPLDRLVLFSDAVFAIAITLLVIEIHVPELRQGATDSEYWLGLAHLIPNFVGYAVSFGVIGAFWAGHHRSFSLVGYFDRKIIFPNLLLLGAIGLMPFLTAFMSAHNGRVVPAAVYWGWLVLTALLSLRVNTMASSAPLLADDVQPEDAKAVRKRSRSVVIAAVTAFSIALVVPTLAPLGMATIPAWMVLLGMMDRPAARNEVDHE